MKGKCNCGKKAESEFLVFNNGFHHTIKLCFKCRPKSMNSNLVLTDGKKDEYSR